MDAASFSSGAKRSEKVLPWWMIPWDALEVIVKRFKKGQDKGYGVHNWKRAMGTGDLEFIRQLYDHTQRHLAQFILLAGKWDVDGENEGPLDHLGAAGWGILGLLSYAIHDKDNLMKAFTQEPE